jgi:hypothetical protein
MTIRDRAVGPTSARGTQCLAANAQRPARGVPRPAATTSQATPDSQPGFARQPAGEPAAKRGPHHADGGPHRRVTGDRRPAAKQPAERMGQQSGKARVVASANSRSATLSASARRPHSAPHHSAHKRSAPTIRRPTPGSHYPAPTTQRPPPTTQHPPPSTPHPPPGTHHPAPTTRQPARGSQHEAASPSGRGERPVSTRIGQPPTTA